MKKKICFLLLLILINFGIIMAQIRVVGIVVDEREEPIIGASVQIKGTGQGTVSDVNGTFSLTVPIGYNTLIISYVGMRKQELTASENMRVILQMDTEILDEIIVVGYGTQKKVNIAGAVESVDSKTLANRATSNVALLLQGVVPNLTITPWGGGPDDVPSLNIRGETSINGGSPLILVNGIPTSANELSRMNSTDIENISLLKDASSAAIYGARAAFGVILITTKKGVEGKPKVQINSNYNIHKPTRLPEYVLDPYIVSSYRQIMAQPYYDFYTDEEIEYAKKRRDDPSLPSAIISKINPNVYTYLGETDWYHEIFDDLSSAQKHNLSISGGNDNVKYYLGAEYYYEKGILKLKKDVMNRYNVRNHVEYRPVDWLTVGNNTSIIFSKYTRPYRYNSYIFDRLAGEWMNSLIPVYNPDGSYTQEGAETVGAMLNSGDLEEKTTNVSTQFTADFEIFKNVLNIKVDFTAKLNNWKSNQYRTSRNISYSSGPEGILRNLGWPNWASYNGNNSIFKIFNLYGNFRKDFGKHNLSAVVGFNQEDESYIGFYTNRTDLITDSYPTIQLATGEIDISEDKWSWATRSAFYRLTYIFDKKYIIETNGRYDGTSRFPKNSRFGFFPSVSSAWIISNESFFNVLSPVISYMKVRGSYGSLGNQSVSEFYPYIASMSAGRINYLLDGVKPIGISAPSLVSRDLTWETVISLNGGLDINFFNNRLVFSGDIYRRETKNMLTKGKTLPNVLGVAEPRINAADLETKGWELSFLWRDKFNLRHKPFAYSLRFILSDSRAFITKFDNPTNYIGDYYVGQEIGNIWGLQTLGFFKDQADIDSHADQWDVTAYPGDRPIEPGDLKYADRNDDNYINRGKWTVDDPGDFYIIGNDRNRYNYGLDLNTEWNGFDLRMLLQGVGRKDVYLTGYKAFGIYHSPWGGVYKANMDHWTPENPNALYPRLKSYIAHWSQFADLNIPQTRYLQNAAYMRLKNITFGYTLPNSLLSNIKVDLVRLYFTGENLFEITKLHRNYDPEGLNQWGHPFQRTLSLGLNITF